MIAPLPQVHRSGRVDHAREGSQDRRHGTAIRDAEDHDCVEHLSARRCSASAHDCLSVYGTHQRVDLPRNWLRSPCGGCLATPVGAELATPDSGGMWRKGQRVASSPAPISERFAPQRLGRKILRRTGDSDHRGGVGTAGQVGASGDALDAARVGRRGQKACYRGVDFRPPSRTFFQRRRNCSRIAAVIGSTPSRKIPKRFNAKSKRCAKFIERRQHNGSCRCIPSAWTR